MTNVVPVIPRTLTEQGSGGTTSFSVNMPATVLPGEVLFAHIGGGGGLVTATADWLPLGGSNQTAADSAYGFAKYATGTEGGTSVVFTLATAGRATAVVTRYQNVRSISPLAGTTTTGQNLGVGSNLTLASLTTTLSNAFLASGAAGNAATGPPIWTPPAGFTNMVQSTGTGKGSAFADGPIITNPGLTGTKTWSWTSSGLAMDGYLVALGPTTAVQGSTALYSLPYTVPDNPANMPPEQGAMMGAVQRGLVGRIATKTVDESRPSEPPGITQLDNQLRLSVVAGAVYKVECYFIYTTPNTINIQFYAPAGSTGDFFPDGAGVVSIVPTTTINRAYSSLASPIPMGPLNISTVSQSSLYGFLTIGGTGGRVVIGWGPGSPGTPIPSDVATLKAGCKLRLRRIG